MTETMYIVPFAHQSECLGVLRYVRASAKKMALVIMAGGLGKTITAALHVKERLVVFKESRCLFLCHQNDILEQAQGEFAKVLGNSVRFGFFHGFEKTADAQIVFASFQTMRGHLAEFDPKEFDTIIVDETHRSKADTFEKVIRHFKPEFLLGITATPDREDGRDIREIYGNEVYNLPLPEALARGLLSPLEYKLMSDEISLKEVLETPSGNMSMSRLNRTVFVPKRDSEIASIITRHMGEVERPKVIIFCASLKHCEHMAKVIPGAVPIHSNLHRNERRTRLELFRQSVFQVAVTVDMFNEALDIPDANLIVFLRSTESRRIFFQQLSRGLRPHEDKPKVVILDFVGNCERISFVYELWKEVSKQRVSFGQSTVGGFGGGVDSREPFSLNVESVEFKERIIPLIEFIGRIKADFYPTWQEAGKAACSLGTKTSDGYASMYKNDPRLPSAPHRVYADWPGWDKFLEKEKYPTWQDAAKAAFALGGTAPLPYKKVYKNDPRLPVKPAQYYADFPGWTVFAGRTPKAARYLTWAEVVGAINKLGIKSELEYNIRYKEDPRLRRIPRRSHYPEFTSWKEFFQNKDIL